MYTPYVYIYIYFIIFIIINLNMISEKKTPKFFMNKKKNSYSRGWKIDTACDERFSGFCGFSGLEKEIHISYISIDKSIYV